MGRVRTAKGPRALLFAAVVAAVFPKCGPAWTVPSWDLRLTEPGAVSEWLANAWCGHAQGMCATSNALYFAFRNQIVRTDWYGRFQNRIGMDRSCGDICHWNGSIYACTWLKPRTAAGRWCVRIGVYDAETLRQVMSRDVPWDHGAHGIACCGGTLYLGMGRYAPDPSGRSNWYGRFDAATLEPIGEPFVVDHGAGSTGGPQALASDGTFIYASFYPATGAADTPCLVVFDASFNVVGRHVLNWQQGFDVVPGGTDGAVRFINCTTANWKEFAARPVRHVQVAVQFAELKNGVFRDITRHCVFSTPLPR